MKHLYNTARIPLLIALATPLIVTPGIFMFPFVVPKIWIFRILIEISIACALLIALSGEKLTWKPSRLQAAVGLYVVIAILSAVWGVDFHRSWWAEHERMLGVFSLMHYAALAFLLPFLFHGWKNTTYRYTGWETVFRIWFATAVVVAAVAMYQHWIGELFLNKPGGRVYGTLGNFIYLGNYMSLSIFVGIMLWCQSKKRNRAYITTGIALIGIALWLSGSRGAIAATMGGIVIALALVAHKQKYTYIRNNVRSISILLILATLIFGKPAFDIMHTTYTHAIHDIQPRLIAWQVAVEAWKEKPLLGWGYGNFFIAFNKHFDPRSAEFSIHETWFDNAHNVFLNTLTETGALGLIAYLALFYIALHTAIKTTQNTEDIAMLFALAGALSSLILSKITAFDDHTSLMLTFALFGYIDSRSRFSESTTREHGHIGTAVRLFAIILTLTVIWNTNIKPAYANHQTIRIIQRMHTSPEEYTAALDEALRIDSPHIAHISMEIARHVKLVIPTYKTTMSPNDYATALHMTVQLLEKARLTRPLDPRPTMEQAIIASMIGKDAPIIALVDERMREAIRLSPQRPQLYHFFGQLLLSRDDYQGAYHVINQAIEINPRLGYSYWLRAKIRHAGNEPFEKVVEDMRIATVVKGFIPRGFKDTQFTADIFSRGSIVTDAYDKSLIKTYEMLGEKPPKENFERLIRTYESTGLYGMAQAAGEHARSYYADINTTKKKQPAAQSQPLTSALAKHDAIALPAYMYEAAIFALAYEGNHEAIADILEDIAKHPRENMYVNTETLSCIETYTIPQKTAVIPYDACGGLFIPFIPDVEL